MGEEIHGAEADVYVAGRADIWLAAHALLRRSAVEFTPEDIIQCATFLAGDEVRG